MQDLLPTGGPVRCDWITAQVSTCKRYGRGSGPLPNFGDAGGSDHTTWMELIMNTKQTKSITLTAMPTMPKMRKAKPTRPCVCGCGQPTKGMWFPGHDGRAKGWALRVMRNVITIDDVPINERAGCELMMARLAESDAVAVNS